MPPIHRPAHYGTVKIDVSLLERIEAVAAIDCAEPPDVIAKLWARAKADRDDGRDPEYDSPLVAETKEALDGHWLSLWETHAIQRLRGWNRARYGMITVDARWLTAARNVLDDFTLSFESNCDETLREYGLDLVRAAAAPDRSGWPSFESERAEILVPLTARGLCGECTWYCALLLRDEVDAVLDATGFDGGVYYRAYCLGETQEQLGKRYGWKAA
jgi:hypothetical protein